MIALFMLVSFASALVQQLVEQPLGLVQRRPHRLAQLA